MKAPSVYGTLCMVKRSSAIVLLLLSACGTSKPAPSSAGPTVVVAPAPAPTAAPVASDEPKPSPAEPEAEPGEPDCSDAAFATAEKELEAAEARRDPTEIEEKLRNALDIRTRDVPLHNQLLQLLKNTGQDESAAEEARILIAIGDTSNALAWTLLGIEADNNKETENARAYYARAVQIDPKGEAAARLGTRSRCTGALTRGTPESSDIDIVKGWLGVYAEVDSNRMVREEDKPEPKTEAAARERVCINNNLSEITERGVCTGKGPWTVQTGHMHFHDHKEIIIPLSGNRFALWSYFTGDGCRGGSESSASVVGDVIILQSTALTNVVDNASPCDEGPHDGMTAPCITDSTYYTNFFDARTGKALLSITEHSSSEKHEVKNGKLTRTEGAACKETIDLRPAGKGK